MGDGFGELGKGCKWQQLLNVSSRCGILICGIFKILSFWREYFNEGSTKQCLNRCLVSGEKVCRSGISSFVS